MLQKKQGSLVGILDVHEKEDLIITCKSGITLRTSLSSIKEAGRATQGVNLIRLDEGDEIAAISKIEEQEVAIKDEGEMNDETNNIYKDADDQPEDSNTSTIKYKF